MSIQPRRIRLKPWLVAQVNSGNYPGLQWLSKDHKLFQIPWHHATRHMPTPDEENTIFRAWALETGKYQEGVDEPDPAKWKANLRCALNKSREFKLKYDGTKETPVKPYKIYEVCDHLFNGDQGDDEDEELPNIVSLSIEPGMNDPSSFPVYPAHRGDISFPPSMDERFGPAHIIPAMPLLQESVQTSAVGGGNITAHLPQSTVTPQDFRHVPMMSGVEQGMLAHSGAIVNGMAMDTGVTEISAPAIPAVSMGESPMPGVQTVADTQVQHCIYDLLSCPHVLPLTDLDIKFQYRGRMAGSLTVSNPQGCRLYYGHLEPTPEQVDLFGPVSLNQVLFPSTAEIVNEKQKFYTDHLLDVMDRGLILEIRGQDIYAVRLCQCKVFWSGPGVLENGLPNPMEREKKIRVFSLNEFLHGLILYQKNEAPSLPPFEIYFCFGEDWPDKKPKEKKLIIVQVVPVVARILTEMFSGEVSWSLDSIRLQISNPDLKDQTVEQFKELQRLLQSQHGHSHWAPTVS
ncbi:hypothetical protein ACEWY4_001298 [Coilia grayii]|uniref:IRF tryptophan pentad repeat domain-containing protein n=1 Tax=Coilia grayii TaxID=363190 RepID=A0ABD1KSI0_9TELE